MSIPRNAKSLFQLTDSLRSDSGIDARQLPVQLAALIYLRWVDFQEAERETIAAFEDRPYDLLLPESMYWRVWHASRGDELVGTLTSRLPAALSRLHNVRHNPLATYLHHMARPLFDLANWSVESLSVVVQWLADQPFETPSDRRALLEDYDEFLNLVRQHPARFGGGEHSDPPWIVRLVAGLAAASQGDSIYDPCFGVGGYLVAVHDSVVHSGDKTFHRVDEESPAINGVEINRDPYIIAVTRMALVGVDTPRVEFGNSLERPANQSNAAGGFDRIVANPPWGMRVGPEGLDHFPIRSNDAVGLFVQHIVGQLKPDGRAVVVVPNGFLFRKGADQRVREMLLTEHSVEMVISLPEGAFNPATNIATAILVIRHGSGERVRMIDGEELLRPPGKRAVPDEKAVETVLALARSTETADDAWNVTVSELEPLDWDLTPVRRDQSGLDEALDALAVEIPISTLKEQCVILSGHAIKSADLLDDSPRNEDGATIPYIRVGDIRSGIVERGSKWLSPTIAGTLDPKWKLKSGDVLISKSGTIGKAGIVRNGAVGAVAAGGILVLRPTGAQLDPHFLSAYLSAAECRAWLDGRARGKTISHLSRDVLDEMPVPVPPIPVQQRVVESYREHGVDVLPFLAQLLLERSGDPIVEWIDGALNCLKSDEADRPGDLYSLRHAAVFGESFVRLQERLRHEDIENLLRPWVSILATDVVPPLGGVEDVPPGPARYSIVQQVTTGARGAENAIEGHLPHANRARELTRLVVDKLSAAEREILEDVRVSVSSSQTVITRAEQVSLILTLTNEGVLPLRDVHVSIEPWERTVGLGYVPEGATKEIPLDGRTPSDGDVFTITASWRGITMNGESVDDRRELSFEMKGSGSEQTESSDMGGSPYVCGDPITPKREELFVGREETLETIKRSVQDTGNVILLEGNRRAGKTSILRHLEGTNGVPGWFGVYASLQGAEGSKHGVGVPTDEVFRALARSIAVAVHTLGGETPLPNGEVLPADAKTLTVPKACRAGISPEAPYTDFAAYLEVVLEVLEARELRLLLMLDEFDKLQEGIDNGVTSPQVPENIRYLVQSFPGFSAILTGSRRLRRLREEHWSALYGLGTHVDVKTLDPAAAERLITYPVRGRLTYSREAIERCTFLTAGQPYLIQCVCNQIFDTAVRGGIRSITVDLVQNAADRLIEENEHFASLWDYAGTDRRRYLLALCHTRSEGREPMRLGVIQEYLAAEGIEISDEQLIADLEVLQELDLLDFHGDRGSGHYRLSIPLMGIWIDRQRDVEAVLAKARRETEEEDD
ncbi:MAG: N-6 DNA methylase [Alkalispirochaeta sp.]